MAFKMIDAGTAIGASLPVRCGRWVKDHFVEVFLTSSGTTKITAATVILQGGSTNPTTCVSTNPSLADGSTAQRIANGAFYYQIDGTNYTIGANATGTVVTHVNGTALTQTITGSKFGGVVVVANAAGAIRVIPPANGIATGVQAYDSAEALNLVLDAIVPTSGWCYLGKLVITAAGGGFTWGTTALTGVSTFYDASCPYHNLQTYALDATDITNQQGSFSLTNKHVDFVRVYLSALTGAGYVSVKYTPTA